MEPNDDLLGGLQEIAKGRSEKKHKDAEKYKELKEDECMLCWAEGQDKRNLFIDCFYDVSEAVPEALVLDLIDSPIKLIHNRGWYLRICKTCRAALLIQLKEWRKSCVAARQVEKDSDGMSMTVYDDPERNIPYRLMGATVMLTLEEYEHETENSR